MAETANLTSAHAHARKALDEQQQTRWSRAAEEHRNAATEFSKTARTTTDGEALRVLKLLEEEHRKLARIVMSYDLPQPVEGSPGLASPSETAISANEASPSPSADKKASATQKSSVSALAGTRIGSQVRDSSPSLARDIASRRGIPPPGRTQHMAGSLVRARQLSPESQRRARMSPNQKNSNSANINQSSPGTAIDPMKQRDDEGFSKFYSSITSGTMSKLSSALAYAGLPLNPDEHTPAVKPGKRTVSATNEPDVKTIFSKAALEAVEEEHRQRGTFGHGFGPAESFYVVQTGGGTHSYADIARVQQQQQHHPLSGIDEEDDEAFVDAREAPAPPSPKHTRVPSWQKSRGSFGNPHTQEELELENSTLKQTLEQIANRLAIFEAHAQDASMAALTQSMASLRPDGGERVRQLELQVEQQAEEQRKLEALAAKQKETLKKYQAKWEEVKKSAKEKDRIKREKADKALLEGNAGTAKSPTSN